MVYSTCAVLQGGSSRESRPSPAVHRMSPTVGAALARYSFGRFACGKCACPQADAAATRLGLKAPQAVRLLGSRGVRRRDDVCRKPGRSCVLAQRSGRGFGLAVSRQPAKFLCFRLSALSRPGSGGSGWSSKCPEQRAKFSRGPPRTQCPSLIGWLSRSSPSTWGCSRHVSCSHLSGTHHVECVAILEPAAKGI